jgi:hypothetical protein
MTRRLCVCDESLVLNRASFFLKKEKTGFYLNLEREENYSNRNG